LIGANVPSETPDSVQRGAAGLSPSRPRVSPAQPNVGHPSRKVVSAVLVAFLLESILSRAVFAGWKMPISLQMGATAALFAVIGYLAIWTKIPSSVELRLSRQFAPLFPSVFFLASWGLAASLASDQPLLNTLFWSLWAANFLVIWWAVPRVTWFLTTDDRTRLITFVVVIIIFGCIAMHPLNGFDPLGRFRGMFINATFPGHLLCISVVWLFALLLHNRASSRRGVFALLILAGLMLLLTGTRTGIFGATVGVGFSISLGFTIDNVWHRRRYLAAATLALCVLVTSVVVLAIAPDLRHKAAQRFRLHGWDSPLEAATVARGRYWSKGIEEFTEQGWFGQGFLSKWGIVEYDGGLTMPRVRYLYDEDPHSTPLTVAQQIGLPAVAFFALYLASLLYMIVRCKGEWRPSLLAYFAMIFAWMVGENSLTSFGSPGDRVMLVLIALLVTPAFGGRMPQRALHY